MIARDEAEMLPGCLDSVRGAVDEIVLVDTGSIDDTPRVAAEYGARVLRHEWHDHFADARNVSVEAATGDWILWIDADERLRHVEHRNMRTLVSRARVDAYLVSILSPNPTGSHTTRAHRLFRNRKGIRFSGRIHEQVWPSIERLGGRVTRANFTIDHLGYNLSGEEQQKKNERNLRMLLIAKQERPRDSYIRFTLGQAYLSLANVAAAEKEIAIALGEDSSRKMRKPLPNDIRASAYTNLANCALKRGAPVEAFVRCDESLQVSPRQIAAHLIAYRARTTLGQEEEALRELLCVEELYRQRKDDRQRLGACPDAHGGAAIEIEIKPAELWRAIGHTSLRLGRVEKAREAFQKALDIEPGYAGTLAALARCAIEGNQLEEALGLAEKGFGLNPEDDGLLDLISFIQLKLGRFDDAAKHLQQLVERRPGDQSLKRRLAGVLIKLDRPREAADLVIKINGSTRALEAAG